MKLIDKDSTPQDVVANMTGPLQWQGEGIGKDKGGLYILPSTNKPSSLATALHSTAGQTSPQPDLLTSSTLNSSQLQFGSSTSSVTSQSDLPVSDSSIWHLRLGHAPVTVLQKIGSLQPHLHLQNKIFHSCLVCPLARQTRSPFPFSAKKTVSPFELLHMDVWGPYKQCTYNGHRFFLTIVDDYSRMTWIFLLRYKSDVITFITTFMNLIRTQCSAAVKIIRSDNGLEFFNTQCSTLFSSLGVIHQTTCVHTPQQNGVVERKHRHLLEMARALRFQAYVPLKFWGECILIATFLINRLPSSVLGHKSPYEVFHKQIPSLTHLRVFGCLCYATNTTNHDKFAPRAIPSIFMGYSDTQKGYKLYNIATRNFFVSRDVSFRESIFPFKYPKHTFQDSLPSTQSSSLVPGLTHPADDTFTSSAPSSTSPPLSPTSSTKFPASSTIPLPPTEFPALLNIPSDPASPAVPPAPQRKSSRSIKPPIWHTDYVTTSKTPHPISSSLSYTGVIPTQRHTLI